MDRRELVIGTTTLFAFGALDWAKAQNGLKVRRNLASLDPTDDFFDDYAEAIASMHALDESDARNWRAQSLIHSNFCPHGMSDFFSWHRHYITHFERICAELIGKPGFTLPYWDWTENNGRLPAQFFADGPLNVEHWNDPSNHDSPMWGRRISTVAGRLITVSRGLGDDPVRGGAFTERSIGRIMAQTNFDRFQRRLEGSPHGNGHVVVGGSRFHMGSAMSPLDPIFWLHHCNVDRLWAKWQVAGNQMPSINRTYRGQFCDANGNSIQSNANEATDFRAMGFTYDELEPQFLTAGDRVILAALTDDPPDPSDPVQPESGSRFAGTANDERSFPFEETRIDIQADALVDVLSTTRRFNAFNVPFINRAAIEPSRILAELEIEAEQGGTDELVANVFVNCGYLAPDTPWNDEHFADSFSFFGTPMGESRKVIVDITDPLRTQASRGRLRREIAFQIMPIPADPGGDSDANFKVKTVDLIQT